MGCSRGESGLLVLSHPVVLLDVCLMSLQAWDSVSGCYHMSVFIRATQGNFRLCLTKWPTSFQIFAIDAVEQVIWRCHLGLWGTLIDILTFFDQMNGNN